MITTDNLLLIDSEEYELIGLDVPIIEKDKDNKFIMELNMKFSKEENKKIYRFFIKSKKVDDSRIKFLSFLTFPDGIILEVFPNGINCHIVELKKSPRNKLEKIGAQFLSAKLHLTAMFTILGVPVDDNVKFNFYVAFNNDKKTSQEKFNTISPVKKVTPGAPVVRIDKRIEEWENSVIYFSIGNAKFRETVQKVKLDAVDSIGEFSKTFKEIEV